MSSEENVSTRKRARSSGYSPKPPMVNTQQQQQQQHSVFTTPQKSKNSGSPSPSMSSGSSSVTGISLPMPINSNNSINNEQSSPRTVASSPGIHATPISSASATATTTIHTPLKMLFLTAERERAEECWVNRLDVRLKEIEVKGFSLYAVEDWLFEKDMPWVVQVLTGLPSSVVRMYRIGINDVLPQYKHILNGAITVDHPEITSHVVNK